MQWRCKNMMMGMKHGHPPFGGLFFAMSMIAYMVIALKLTFHIAQSLETLAIASSLHKAGGNLSEEEKTELTDRIKENLFGA